MMPTADNAAPAESPAAPAAIDPNQGFTIEIACLPDGTFNVSAEPLQAEAAEENATGGADKGRTLNSPEEAFRAAVDLYKSNSAGTDDAQANNQFNAGFGATQGKKVL